MDCVLHIGIGKAGSSSLQGGFEAHRATLLERGILYPDDLLPNGRRGGDNQKCLAVSAMSPQRKNFVLQQHRATTPPARAAFDSKVAQLYRTQIEANPGKLCLLSAEHFWSCLGHASEVETLHGKLRELGLKTTRVIVYMRRQSEWFESFLHQRIREGRGLLVREAATLLAQPTTAQLDYQKLIETWARHFPEAQIIPRIFAREAMVQGDIMHDFCAAADIAPLDDLPAAKNVSSVSNAGVNAMLKLREMLEIDPRYTFENSAWRRLTEVIENNMPGSCAFLKEAEMQVIDSYFAASNEAVRAQYFPTRESLFLSSIAKPNRETFHVLKSLEFEALLNVVLVLWQQTGKSTQH